MLNHQDVILGDCLDKMTVIEDKSIDMILCDLPYEVTARNAWDIIIPFDKLWQHYKRVAKDNAAIVLTATQPFASKLVLSNLEWFKYEWVWRKQQGTGFLNAKKQPLRNHEQILIFYKSQPTYNPQFTEGKPYTCKQGRESLNYGKITPNHITENNGTRYPLTVMDCKYDKNKLHPTQKPLALFEYLIKTYTNEGDTILDNCAGSFTTFVACDNLNRRCICIEKEEKYFQLGLNRINENRKILNNNGFSLPLLARE